MKTQPRKNASIKNILAGINEGTYYVNALMGDNYKPVKGFTALKSEISTLGKYVNTDARYTLQKTKIAEKQKGNLGVFAGKKVQIICTTISRNGPQINYLIKECK